MPSSDLVFPALDVLVGPTIYLAIGRRPSAVYLDAQMKTPTTDVSVHRLWDLVFLRTVAVEGDQLQDGIGGIMLVNSDGQGSPIQLLSPTPRSTANAFTQSAETLAADRALLRQMVEQGHLQTARLRRLTRPAFQPSHVTFSERHALVVDSKAEASDWTHTPPPATRHAGTSSRRWR